MIVGEPRRSLLNSTFYLKMALLAVAILLTAGLQWFFTTSRISGTRSAAAADRGSNRGERLIAGLVRHPVRRTLDCLYSGGMMQQLHGLISYFEDSGLADNIRENECCFR